MTRRERAAARLVEILSRNWDRPAASGGFTFHGHPVAIDSLSADDLERLRGGYQRMADTVTAALAMPTRETAEELLTWADSYGRLHAIVALHRAGLRLEDVLALLGEEWSVCDNIATKRRWLRAVLPRQPTRLLMTEAEWNALQALPEQITVYRGADRGVNERGLSWSLDRATAARFPFLMRYRAADPVLVTATVRRDRVTALKLDREESEIIAFGPQITCVASLSPP